MTTYMDNNDKDMVVFYGPLPVNKPYPIVKPSEHIQLQPTINPVAITPYVAVDGDMITGQNATDLPEEEEYAKDSQKNKSRLSARVSGGLMLLFGILAFLIFGLSFAKDFPIKGLENASIDYFINGIRNTIGAGNVGDFKSSFAPILVTIAFVAIGINTLLSFLSLCTGKRHGYTLLTAVAFVALIVASFYGMKFFSDIKNIGKLLTKDYGWSCIMLIIIGAANVVISFLCNTICPKYKFVETVEF